tara:strand:+ start:706 stop:906 length:201 start_codon:yes stop_codon:yes gene_type:complete
LKYKNLKKSSSVDDYLDNLFLAVTDIYWSMVLDSDISEKEARRLIIRDVNMVLDESIKQYEEDDVQ